MTKSSRSNKSSALDEQKKHRTGRRDAVPSAPHTRTLAKLSRPRLFQALSRERLFGLLDAAVERPLVYIAAEPGAGKTTLLASYLGDRRIAALWYRVDEGDGDIATFFYFIRQAAERMHGGDAGLPLLTPEYAEDLEGFSRRFFRILFAALPQSCVLAFDNMHTVAAAAELHRVLAAAAAETPDGAAIVCLSRTEPAPAYATLFANGLAARINAETLKLTEKETASLVSRRNGLDDDAARLLHTRTGGWAAGVCLLAEAWERDPGITGSLGKVTVQQVGDYFGTEILQHLSPQEAQALTRCALLPTLTAKGAQHLTGYDEIGSLLERLYRRRLFTEKQETGEGHYRFHDLFRAFLADALRSDLDERQRRGWLTRAAHTALQTQDAEAAMPLLLEAGEVAAATALVRQYARRLLTAGRFRTLRQWVEGIGDSAMAADPWLRFWWAHAAMPSDIGAARQAFEDAYRGFLNSGDRSGQLLACAQVVSSYYYAYVDYAPMQIWVTCIERLLAEAVTLADIADEADLYTALVFAVTWLAQMDEKPVTARAERLLLDPALEANQQVSLAYALSDFYTLGSRMTDARRVMTNVSLDKGRGVTTLNLVYARLQLGYQMLRAGEYENAAVLWDEADRIAAEDGLTQTRFLSSVFRSFLHSCRLQVEQAEAQLAGLAIEATDAQPLSAALYHVAKVFAALAREDARAAARHARISLVHATRLGGGFVNVAWRAHGSAALAMAGDHAEAERWIDEGLRWASGSWLQCYQTNLLMSRAYSLLLRGERSAAHAVMARMLELARENDWWTYLRIVPNVKDIVVREAVAASIDPPFCKRLVRELRVSPGSEPPEQWPWEVRLYALGPFLVERHGAPLAFGRKAQKRPLALLKALVALGPEGVDAGRLASALWPDAEADDAADSLNMAVHRLRNLIGEETVSVRDGKISLNSQLVWTDTGALVRVLDAIEDSEAASAEQQVQTLEQLYRGHFLEHEPQESWLLPLQQRLRGRIHRAILSLGRRLEEGRAWEQAVALYERGIDLDPLAERLYARLMHCHLESGRASAATAAYRRCCEMLSKMAGTAPSTETQAIHAAILSATIR